MIAVVTSTLQPTGVNQGFYSFEERLAQTKQTLTQLRQHGFEAIYLIDNSPSLNQTAVQKFFSALPSIRIYHLLQHQFANKGINELLMLLFITDHLPQNEPVFKISGRYAPVPSFNKPKFVDFAVKGYTFHTKTGTISTRGYWVKDADTLQQFLRYCLAEVFSYPQRIVGYRSLARKMAYLFLKKPYIPVNISIEFAAANIFKDKNYKVTFLTHLGIEGWVGGGGKAEKITE